MSILFSLANFSVFSLFPIKIILAKPSIPTLFAASNTRISSASGKQIVLFQILLSLLLSL